MAWVTSIPPAVTTPPQGWAVTPTVTAPVPPEGWLLPPFVLLTGGGTLAALVQPIVAIPGALSGLGALAAGATQIYLAEVTPLSAVGHLSAAAAPQFDVSAALAGSGSFTALVVAGQGIAAALSGSGSLTATVTAAGNYPQLSGSGALSAVAMPIAPAALSGVGALAASAFQQEQSSAALSALGALAASVSQVYFQGGALTGAGALVGQVVPVLPVPVGLSGSGALAATAGPLFASAAALAGSGALSAAAVQRFLVAGALAGTGALSASAVAKLFPTYDSTGAGHIAAGATSQTEAHTLTAAANCLLVVAYAFSGVLPSSVKVGTTALTYLNTVANNNSSSNGAQYWYYVLSPPTGAQTITVAYSSAPQYSIIGSLAYQNVSAVGALQAAYASAAQTSFTQNATGAVNGRIVQAMSVYSILATSAISSYNQTQRYYSGNIGSGTAMMLGDAAGAASVAFTAGGNNAYWGAGAVSLT